jgi:hypothetical protein
MRENTTSQGVLAVIVINWNNAPDTIKCLESLASWESLKPELYVVDNASTDDSLRRIEGRFSDIWIIRNNKNLGFAGGNNNGIKKAMENGSTEILLLNNDAKVEEADISRMLAHLRARPDIAVVGPRIRAGNTIMAGGCDIGHNPDTHIPWEPRMGIEGIKQVEYVPGTVFLVRRGAIEKVGLLDEDYFFSGEIADFCRRIYDAGMVCCVDLSAEAVHGVDRPSRMRNTLYAYYSARNRFLYVKKHAERKRIALYGMWIRYFLQDLAISIAHGDLARSRAIALALFDGVTGAYGDHNDRFIA